MFNVEVTGKKEREKALILSSVLKKKYFVLLIKSDVAFFSYRLSVSQFAT